MMVHYSYMKHISRHVLHTLFGLVSSFLVLVILLISTSPYKLPLVLLLLPSLALGVVVFFLSRLVQAIASQGQTLLVPIAVSLYVVLLSLLTSLQQLTWKDGFFAAFLLLLGVFYYKRNIQS